MTLTSGAAAVHQSIVGDRMRLPLDAELSHAVTGAAAALAHPALVCDVAIGQSTLVTQRVKANLFYRGLIVPPLPGPRRHACTPAPKSLASNRTRPSRDARRPGLAALRMTTVDQVDRLVLDFYRCAMLPLSADAGDTGHDDDLSAIGTDLPPGARSDRRLGRRGVPRDGCPAPHFDPGLAGTVLHSTADVVSSAPELARLTLNIAATHHDSRVGGPAPGLRRAHHRPGAGAGDPVAAQPRDGARLGVLRPHRPVHEGDTLYSELHVEAVRCRRPRRRAEAAVAGLRGGRARPAGTGLAVHALRCSARPRE